MDAYGALAAEIATLQVACRVRLESCLPKRLRRTEYHQALRLADEAVQMAVEAALDAEAVAACEELQKCCEDVLRGWYSARDQREKDAYERAAAAAPPAGTRPVLARRNSEPQRMPSSVWWTRDVVAGEELRHPTNLTPTERRPMVTNLKVRIAMAAGLPERRR